MPITRTAMVDDDGSGTTGTILNNAWKQEFYDQIDGLAGAWIDVAFNAANFSAAGATWTVPAGFQQALRYLTIPANRIVFVQFQLGGNTTISVATSTLIVTVPGMPSPVGGGAFSSFNYWIPSALGAGAIDLSSAGQQIRMTRDMSGTVFPAHSANVTYLSGQGYFRY